MIGGDAASSMRDPRRASDKQQGRAAGSSTAVRKDPERRLRALTGMAALLALAGCQPAVLDPAGPVASAEKTILIDSLVIMLAIVVPTILGMLGIAWWFRSSNTRARYTPEWAYSGRIEMITWSIPLLTIMLLGGVAWVASHDLDPAKPLVSKTPALDVQVVSLDWKWLFIYPNQRVASVNRLVLPAATPIHFTLTSASVMTAFFVPQLGSMIYTMNGMADQLNLQADHPGTFLGLASHYNGDGFSNMHFDVQAVPQQQFDAWVQTTRQSGPTLDQVEYTKLAQQSIAVPPFTYRDADATLFARVVDQSIPPGPGPHTGLPNKETSPRTER